MERWADTSGSSREPGDATQGLAWGGGLLKLEVACEPLATIRLTIRPPPRRSDPTQTCNRYNALVSDADRPQRPPFSDARNVQRSTHVPEKKLVSLAREHFPPLRAGHRRARVWKRARTPARARARDCAGRDRRRARPRRGAAECNRSLRRKAWSLRIHVRLDEPRPAFGPQVDSPYGALWPGRDGRDHGGKDTRRTRVHPHRVRSREGYDRRGGRVGGRGALGRSRTSRAPSSTPEADEPSGVGFGRLRPIRCEADRCGRRNEQS